MKIDKLYEKLATLRDDQRPTQNACYEDVFEQLILLASRNEWPPDELPKVFILHNIPLSLEQFESLMKQIGLNVSIKHIKNNYSYANSFELTQNSKETQG